MATIRALTALQQRELRLAGYERFFGEEFVIRDRQVRKLGFERYSQYLESPLWLEGANRTYLLREGNRGECFVCGSPEIHLHHRTYHSLGREHSRDLVPLCGHHHRGAHGVYNFGYPLWIAHAALKAKVQGGRLEEWRDFL